jgi:homoserine O-acetyltransferase
MVDPMSTTEPQPSRRPALRVVRPPDAPVEDGGLQTMHLGRFDLEMGGQLDDVSIAYRTWGRLNAAGDNAVIILHALTGDSLATGDGGWWEPVIGRDCPIDTDLQFVICANVLGGCSGSTGPSTIDPATGQPYAMSFPLVTIGDIVATQRRLVERLGVTRLMLL